jgi:hypothetical protein
MFFSVRCLIKQNSLYYQVFNAGSVTRGHVAVQKKCNESLPVMLGTRGEAAPRAAHGEQHLRERCC